MNKDTMVAEENNQAGREESVARPLRADAQRSADAIVDAALEVFARSGVEAPVREIAARAGVGIGTLYRRFPQRSDLIVAVFRQQVDACADAAPLLAADHQPAEALALWLQRYVDFIATKRGLASALHSGDPAYASLPSYFDARLRPALQALLQAAASAGEVRGDVEPDDLLRAVGSLCLSAQDDLAYARRMVALLVDGLRFGSAQPPRA
ncbi:TetR family transcriptional regulator [Kouleothrix aurantiaca]|uniref:TetR family transcriptional regulator n=1 Tax=Kouleothrix aurantiaca TaxID=186479 RepID=A0A0N8PR97_9CHLR|nr:TetR family transcriptional regulator [Kouleothrix aurantiaca]